VSAQSAAMSGLPALLTRGMVLIWGVLSVLLAAHWFIDLGMAGFPDGYISPFARATSPLLHGFATGCLAQGLYFLVRGLFGKRLRPPALGLQLVVAAILTVAPVFIIERCPRSQTCSTFYEALTGTMMDDGTGG
jgi:hypothetical protein